MPAFILNQSFKDIFNQSLSFFQANAGDTQEFTCEILEQIRFQSSSTLLMNLDPTNNAINIVGGNFLTEGFRVGDVVLVSAFNSNGNPKGTTTLTNTQNLEEIAYNDLFGL